MDKNWFDPATNTFKKLPEAVDQSTAGELAVDAEVGALVMFHHDPDRTDGELDEIKRENEIFFRNKYASTKCYTAYEGLAIKLAKPVAGGETIYEVI